ncbi:hypothetical protein MTR67_023544 [Solanum verrucosum]|uniref:Uncharacterized protein n=1 Tax=Solanum verrucosum TaxID=315347 RepID=A0AAF0TS95_SOLVR|nr:hypothetical protein MTR67_023544 [Solanum verrucosum]
MGIGRRWNDDWLGHGDLFPGFTGLNGKEEATQNSVRAAYYYLSSTGKSSTSLCWKQIWKIKVPSEVVCLSWLIRKACHTGNSSEKRLSAQS